MVVTKCVHDNCENTREQNKLTCLECPEKFFMYCCPECGSKNPTMKMDLKVPKRRVL